MASPLLMPQFLLRLASPSLRVCARFSVPESPGPVSLLTLWSNRINTANSRKHQEFAGRLNSVNNRAELYQHLKEENGMETTENGKASRQ